MGYRIENYSLSELHRIAIPGGAPPTLFWALPIGDWRPDDVSEVWHWFTGESSQCNDFGLLLVKDLGTREAEHSSVSLAPLGAKLRDLMPAGAERFARGSAYEKNDPRILVLSGGYPQPGWGVLVEWTSIRLFEGLINDALTSLRRSGTAIRLELFTDARNTFDRLKALSRRQPTKERISSLDNELRAGDQTASFFQEARRALDQGEYPLVREKMSAAAQAMHRASWLEISGDRIQQVIERQNTLQAVADVVGVSKKVFAKEIGIRLPSLIEDPSRREAVFKSIGLHPVSLTAA